MNDTGVLKHFLCAFAIALAGYVAFFSCDAHLRQRKGPWQVTFTSDASGSPAIIIGQPGLNIARLKIVFPGESIALPGAASTVIFDAPAKRIPFGRLIGDDLMYLPGTVVF